MNILQILIIIFALVIWAELMTSRKNQVIQAKAHQNKQYEDIINKYKKMAGEYKNTHLYTINKSELISNINSEMSMLPVTTIIKKNMIKKSVNKSSSSISPVKIQQNKTVLTRSPKIVLERLSVAKEQNEDQIQINKQKLMLTQVSEKMTQTVNLNRNKQIKSKVKDKNKTQIKFLVQKEHELLNNNQKYNLKLLQVQSIKPDLNSTKRSSSLPLIAKNSVVTSPTRTQQEKSDRNKSAKGGNQQEIQRQSSRVKNEKRPLSIQNKLQKHRQLNSVAFSLLNLKQRISDMKGISMGSSRMKNNTSVDKKPEQNRQIDHKQYQSEYWVNKSRVLSKKKENNPQKQIAKQEQTMKYKGTGKNDGIIFSKLEKEEVMDAKEEIENGDKKVKIIKLKQKKEHLEQIKQDIQNQNLQKQELLKSHRNINRNLEMDVKNKSQRISQLQNELSKMQSQHEPHGQADDEGELGQETRTKSELQQLQREKKQKEKKYNKQKQIVKQEIKKIEHRILEQELKYKTLQSKELQIKNEQLIQKQEELKEKNKQLGQDLQKKTTQLEEKIKSEQEKLYIYKLQLEEQNKKNQDIWRELKKQQQLQELLIQQIQKIMKVKDQETKVKQQRKQKQKIKMMQEIKALEETESKLLTEYKRDSEAVNSIFEAMRLKNIELQNNIKQKMKKKEKEKQAKQKNQLLI